MLKKSLLVAALALALGIGAAAAGEQNVPNRLATAKIGEWATYRIPNGYQQKLTVIKRDGDGPEAQVTVRVDNIYNNEVVNTVEFARDAGNPAEPPRIEFGEGVEVEVDVGNKLVSVKGRNIEATVVEIDYEYGDDDIDDEEVKWYVSAEIPVFGIIKKEENDVVSFELVDYGEN